MKELTIKQSEQVWSDLFDFLWKNNPALFDKLIQKAKEVKE